MVEVLSQRPSYRWAPFAPCNPSACFVSAALKGSHRERQTHFFYSTLLAGWTGRGEGRRAEVVSSASFDEKYVFLETADEYTQSTSRPCPWKKARVYLRLGGSAARSLESWLVGHVPRPGPSWATENTDMGC